MEYGLWNFHGGLWTGGSGSFPPVEGISRNFYAAVNNEIEAPTFHVTTPGTGITGSLFSNSSGAQSCPTTIRTNLEFLSMKHNVPANNRVPPILMPAHQEELLQSVALESVPLASDIITEQNSMDNLTRTDSSMPALISQQNHNSNSSENNNNLNITISIPSTSTPSSNNNHLNVNLNNNNSHNSNSNEEDDDNNSLDVGKKGKNKLRFRNDDEIWNDINGQGTNIKLENNAALDYLFQQSYQHPMYGMVFSRMSANKREMNAVDDTDEEDELEEADSLHRSIDNMGNTSPSMENGSSEFQSVQNATSGNFAKNGFECGECGLIAETRPGLKKHIAVFHPAPNSDLHLNSDFLKKTSASSKCPISSCRFRSSDRQEMEAHIARHVAGDYKLSQKRRPGSLTPQRVRYEREEYRCQICAYSCTVEKAFYKHLKIHSVGRQTNQIKISCVICGKDRSSEVDMNKHMKKHRDDRYFCCDICIFKTVQLKKLIQHRRMHTGEKPHLCPHCSYRSARRDNLRSHVRRVHKKDNLFCDTFSPRGLVIGENSSGTSATSSIAPTTTSVGPGNLTGQQPPPPPPPLPPPPSSSSSSSLAD